MTKQQKARAHLARAQELIQDTLAFGGDGQTKLNIPSNQKTYNQFGTGPLRKVETPRYHPYKDESDESHCILSTESFECAHWKLRQQVHYTIKSGKYDSGWRLVLLDMFTFLLYHVSNPHEKNIFNGQNATSNLVAKINNSISNAWMPDLDDLSNNNPDLKLPWHRMLYLHE